MRFSIFSHKKKKDLLKSRETIHLYPTLKFFSGQIGPDGTFQAYDVCVRYGFIRDYVDGSAGSRWFDIYRKMQTERGAVSHHNEERFKLLIDSFREKGYDFSSAIHLHVSKDGAYLLGDGSHRLSCCLFFKHPMTSIAYSPDKRCETRDYGIDWFERHGFAPDDVAAIQSVKEDIIRDWEVASP